MSINRQRNSSFHHQSNMRVIPNEDLPSKAYYWFSLQFTLSCLEKQTNETFSVIQSLNRYQTKTCPLQHIIGFHCNLLSVFRKKTFFQSFKVWSSPSWQQKSCIKLPSAKQGYFHGVGGRNFRGISALLW